MAIIERNLTDIKPYERNPRTHSQTQIDQLAELIQKFGFHDSHAIAVDEEGVILWGHGRLMAAEQAGMAKVPVEVIKDLSEGDKKTLRIADNGIAEQSGWDMDALLQELQALEEMGAGTELLSLDESVLEELGDVLLDREGNGSLEDEEADAVPEEGTVAARVKQGEIWQLGRHRLMCGDSAAIADVCRLMNGKQADLMFTDPPYGVSYEGKTDDKLTIENDDVTADQLGTLVKQWFDGADRAVKPGGYFLATVPAGPLHLIFAQDWLDRGWLRQILVWNKSQMVLGHSEYHYKHEPILFGWKPGDRLKSSDRTRTTVWDFDKPLANREHPTMKPVEMWMYGVNNHTLPGGLVYEPFLGSGTTLIACEKLMRTCYGLELSPHYCDVVIQRWEELTGQGARRIDN